MGLSFAEESSDQDLGRTLWNRIPHHPLLKERGTMATECITVLHREQSQRVDYLWPCSFADSPVSRDYVTIGGLLTVL
ncbi:hypothetical protein TNCV_3395961 [Trichonephila clavipes]|nr:hypothetical protein TNCV_3395961 [Trichonephila clavipes]